MDIREALREHGATDQQIQAKVVDLIEEVLAEMSDEDRANGGVRTMVKIRASLMNKLNELNGAIVDFNVASQRAERAQEDAWEVYSKMQNLIYPLQTFIDTHPEIGNLGDSMKAIATYRGMLEATKDVFGESLSDEVMSASIEAASYGAWRTIMGEAQPTTPRKRY